MTYLNIKSPQGTETVDQIDRKDFNSYKEYCAELKRLKNEYRMASNYYSGIYTSQRSTKDWKE